MAHKSPFSSLLLFVFLPFQVAKHFAVTANSCPIVLTDPHPGNSESTPAKASVVLSNKQGVVWGCLITGQMIVLVTKEVKHQGADQRVTLKHAFPGFELGFGFNVQIKTKETGDGCWMDRYEFVLRQTCGLALNLQPA